MRLPTLLSPALRRLLAAALVLGVFMIANTSYLLVNRLADALDWNVFAVGETSLPSLFQAMVLTHTGIGLLLAALMLGFFVSHLPKVWKRYHKSSVASGVLYVAAGLVLVVTGLFILTAAASRDNRWAWWAHVACAAIVPLGYVAHRLVSYTRPPGKSFGRFFVAVAAVVLTLVVWHGFTNRGIVRTEEAQLALERGLSTGPGSKGRDVTSRAGNGFVPVGFVPPGSPFFPSAATTTSGDRLPSRIITRGDRGSPERINQEMATYGHVRDTRIGAATCERCHQDIVAQWAVSAHRFASFNNPFYEATVNDLREHSSQSNVWIDRHVEKYPEGVGQVGRVKSKWCSGCHDPALMLAGQMVPDIDRGSAEAQAGLTCLACHAIDRIHDRTGNGNYNIADEQEDPYLFANASTGSLGAFLHDAAMKAKPTVHKRQMLNPVFRQSEFCAACHKVSLTAPVNNYRWFRGQNEFDNWDDSGVSLNAARTFYLPEERRVCQDCHMPLEAAPLGDVAAKNGSVKSHRFLAVNTALPYVRGDWETIERIEAFLRDEKLSVDIFALKTSAMAQPVMAIDRAKPTLVAGDRVTVDVVVRNRGVGHTFPGGTNDSNEGWLEFSVVSATGEELAISGQVRDDGHLDPMAHVYKALILDKDGKPIHRRNAQDIHVAVFANVINPGTADIAHYEFVVPQELAGSVITMRARLLWRKFDREYTEFAFRANREGFKQFDEVPDLPITEIAADEVSLEVGRAGSSSDGAGTSADPAEWTRFNDYGIGLLLESNTRGASRAFEQVMRLQPQRVDGPLNLAKTAVRDGNVDRAYEYLRMSEAIRTGDARVAWVWGVARQEDGRYEEAALAYQRVLEDFPGDRATWRNLGRTYYLDRQYEKALEAFSEVLRIDPEDRIAHYHRMLCLRALSREDEADRAAAAYAYYAIDESAQEITRSFRLKNPGANLMAQAVRTHRLSIRR